jgi:hypothetical protein
MDNSNEFKKKLNEILTLHYNFHYITFKVFQGISNI